MMQRLGRAEDGAALSFLCLALWGRTMPLFLRLAVSRPALGLQMIIGPLMSSSFRLSALGASATRHNGQAGSGGNSPSLDAANLRTARRAAQLDRLEL
jgi:hypothetical protein